MEKEQGKLIIIVSVVFAMVLLCMICTSGSVPEVKSLQACTPDAVSVLDDGRELYDFILDQNDDETNSIVFYSTHQEIVGVCRWEANLPAGCCARHMGKYSGLDLEYCQVFK